jgi:hypothetical protein
MPPRAECPAILLPVPNLRPGDETECPMCGQRVSLCAPPRVGSIDRWRGLADARISSHWLETMPEIEPGGCLGRDPIIP